MRVLLFLVLSITLPLLAYSAYLALARRKAHLAGEGRLPRWQQAPWGAILMSSLVLMMGFLVYWRFTSGVAPGVKLEPPRLEDGKVVPSRPVEQ
jgi:hypothetical protein